MPAIIGNKSIEKSAFYFQKTLKNTKRHLQKRIILRKGKEKDDAEEEGKLVCFF